MPNPVHSTPRVAGPTNLPASSVITLILLHLIFVLEIAAANYKVLRMWFTYPALRIQSFPVWSPIIEAQFVLFTLCVLGLSAAKPWSAAARIQFPFVDKMMTRFIAAAQLTVVLLLFLRTLPYLGFIYFAPITIFGAVSARKLFTLRARPRIACAVWQTLLVGYYLYWSAHVNTNLVSSPDAYLAAYSCLAILYLLASVLYLRYHGASTPRPLQIV